MNRNRLVVIVIGVVILMVGISALGYARTMRSRGEDRFGEHWSKGPGPMGTADSSPFFRASIHWETYLVLLSEKYAPELTSDFKTEMDRGSTIREELVSARWSARLDAMQKSIDEWREASPDRGTDPRRQFLRDPDDRSQSFRMRMGDDTLRPMFQEPEGLTSHRDLLLQLGEALLSDDPEAINQTLSYILIQQRAAHDAWEALLAQQSTSD